jgi:NitT/TauT family transport system substrate-binding protein
MAGMARVFLFVVVASVCALVFHISQAAEPKLWRHGVITAKSDAGFVWMIRDGGFGEKQGFKLEMPALQDDTLLLKALVAGEVDTIQAGPGIAVIAAAKGIDVRIIGCSWPGLPHVVFAQAGIKSVQDMRGKSMGIASPGALPDLLARVWFENNKIPMSEVKLVSLGSDPDRFKALVAGVVDASIASGEFGTEAAKRGLNMLITGSEIEPHFLRLCEITTGATIAQRGDDLARFLAADIQSHRYALANRDAEIALARKMTNAGADDERAPYMFDFVQRTRAVDPDLSLPAEKFAWMQDLLIKTGNMTQRADLTKLLATDLHAKALALADK